MMPVGGGTIRELQRSFWAKVRISYRTTEASLMLNSLFSYISPDQVTPYATSFTAMLGTALFSWRYVYSSVSAWFVGRPAESYDLSDEQADIISISAARRMQPEKVAKTQPMRRAA